MRKGKDTSGRKQTASAGERKKESKYESSTHIELFEGKTALRLVLFLVCLVVAIVAFGNGINALLTTEAGWQTVTVNTTELNCGDDFTFLYNVGAGETSATKEMKAIRSLYTEACVDAYRLFDAGNAYEEYNNVWYLSEHVNEEVEVDPLLYQALETVEESGTRYLYLGPVSSMYTSLMYSKSDEEAKLYDPRYEEELQTFYLELSEYILDSEAIHVELLGENRVMLAVSEEYLAYAEENGITQFIDFSWMKNAFIVDYIADLMTENGYTRGTIMSADGYVRSFDSSGDTEFAFSLYHRDGNVVSEESSCVYAGVTSIVYFHDYPIEGSDFVGYYTYEDGEIRSRYIDPEDGLSKASIAELIASSDTLSCGQLALLTAPLFIADAFEESGVIDLADEGISLKYFSDGELKEVGQDL
ncbi:MAG: hypothetical protein LUF30_06805 [Lachnospiraceae bacterium]|nr:hypothetical protein [Lachnospiraceae bacterium]